MPASKPKTTRARKPVLIDALTVSELLGCTVQSVWNDLADGKIPAPLIVAGEQRWRIAEIRHWVKDGCPNRTTWERRWYRRS